MNKKIGYFLLATTTGLIILFAARQRTLSELRSSNSMLHRQLDLQVLTTASESATESATDSHSTNSIAQLSPDERMELLRLRGQVLPLRLELQDMSNRVVIPNQPRPQRPLSQASEMPPERQPRMQAMQTFMQSEAFTSASGLAGAIRKYLAEQAGQLPDDLTYVAALARPALSEDVSQRFELMRTGIVPEEARSYTFVAREKEARQLPDGNWVRVYVLANGAVSVGGPVDLPDWPAWERFQEAMDKQRARKEQRKTQP